MLPTAIALVALGEHQEAPAVQASLHWLGQRLPGCRSPYSLAWGILALAEYRNTSSQVKEALDRATRALMDLLDRAGDTSDVCTLAACALALQAVEGDRVFGVSA